MTDKRGRTVSRRGLLGIFGAGARGFSDALQKESQALTPGAPRPAAPARPPSYERRQRPPEHTVPALLEESGVWGVDLRRYPLSVGLSWRIVGEGLAEPLLAVHVSATHYAVVGGECPIDGSDLIWLAFEDRVACPSCGSRWRLDGAVTRGPADSSSASFVAEEINGILHVRTAGDGRR